MTTQISTAWQAGQVSGGTGSTSGKLSFFYDEGTNVISSIIFYEENNAALFASLAPIKVIWPNVAGGNPPATATHFLGREADGHPPIRFINLKNKKFLTLHITELLAITPAAGTTPNLDHFTGRISAVLTNGTWSMNFENSGGTPTRTPVA